MTTTHASSPATRAAGRYNTRGARIGLAIRLIALAIAAAIALALLARPASAAQVLPRPQPQVVTIEEIVGNPVPFFGQTVAVSGTVGELLGQRAFTLEEDQLLFNLFHESLLVVSDRPMLDRMGEPLTAARLDDANVVVTGTVEPFDIQEMEQRTGAAFDETQFATYADRPVLMASSVRLTPYQFPHTGVTVDQITNDPASFYGQTVTVSGEMGQAVGQHMFTVRDDDFLFAEEITVIMPQPLLDRQGQGLDPGQFGDRHVRVTGTVRELDVEMLGQELGMQLDASQLQGWAGGPAIVASSVQVAPAR
jgi:hypothetical protein